jgi:hypothetical protein
VRRAAGRSPRGLVRQLVPAPSTTTVEPLVEPSPLPPSPLAARPLLHVAVAFAGEGEYEAGQAA